MAELYPQLGYDQYQPDQLGNFLADAFSRPIIPAYGAEEGFVGWTREYKTEYSLSLNDLIESDMSQYAPIINSLRAYRDEGKTDLLELSGLITQLNVQLKRLKDDVQWGEKAVLFSGNDVLKNAVIGKGDEYVNIDSERQGALSIFQTSLSQDTQDYFDGVQPGGDQTYAWDDTSTKATYSNVLTLGGNYYDGDGFYADRNGKKLEGDTKAPFLKGDGTRLFQFRDDLFEIQQMIIKAGGPAPKTLGVWDENLAKFMENVLAYANDSRSWEYDMDNGYPDVANQWHSALNEYTIQNESGTQLAEILTIAGYSTIADPKPTKSEVKQALDDLYGNYGLKASAEMYKEDGDFLVNLSTTAAQRQAEIGQNADYLKQLILGTKQYDKAPVQGEEGFGEYEAAKADGRVYEDKTGVYIIPLATEIKETMGVKDPIDVTGTMNDYLEERYAKRIGAVEDREIARENAKLFTNNYLTLSRTGFTG